MIVEPAERPRGAANRVLVGVRTLALLPVSGFTTEPSAGPNVGT